MLVHHQIHDGQSAGAFKGFDLEYKLVADSSINTDLFHALSAHSNPDLNRVRFVNSTSHIVLKSPGMAHSEIRFLSINKKYFRFHFGHYTALSVVFEVIFGYKYITQVRRT